MGRGNRFRLTVVVVALALALALAACTTEQVRQSTEASESAATPSAAPIARCADPTEEQVGQLTGVWDADDGGRYFVRQTDDCVWWFGTSLDETEEGYQDGFANVAVGTLEGDALQLEWADVPLGGILGGGTLTLRVDADGTRMEKLSETGTGFGGSVWTLRAPSASAGAEPSDSAEPSSTP